LAALIGSQPRALAAPSGGDTKECIAAFDQGQHSKTDHKLLQSKQQLLACTKETCPSVLRADCAEVLRSVQSAIPSVVLAADDAGKDITDVKVINGNDTIAVTLDAKAIELDPGTYDFRFEKGNDTPVWVHFVLREGEKNRTVKASFHPRKLVVDQARLVTPPRTASGYIVPGAFVALSIAGFVFGGLEKLSFNSQVSDFRSGTDKCAPVCTQDQRAGLSDKIVRANIGLGVGIGGLVVAAVTWFILTPSPQLVRPTTAAFAW
jgi:hypothetical protein